jgi:hypothetical protein
MMASNDIKLKPTLDELRPDPMRGRASGTDMTNSAFRKPVILWRDRLLTMDVYAVPGEPMYINTFCPLCEMRYGENLNHSLTIKQERKPFHLEPDAMPHAVAKKTGMSFEEMARYLKLPTVQHLSGVLTFDEPFNCTWEEEPELRRAHFAVCQWRVIVENNIARDV